MFRFFTIDFIKPVIPNLFQNIWQGYQLTVDTSLAVLHNDFKFHIICYSPTDLYKTGPLVNRIWLKTTLL